MRQRIMLISMPWNKYNILNIQIGCLKSFLMERGVSVDSRHYYKDILAYLDLPTYESILAANVGELIAASLLFTDKRDGIKRIVTDRIAKIASENPAISLLNFDFEDCSAKVGRFMRDIINDVCWEGYSIVAFTTTHVQFMSSLVVARLLKTTYPDIATVFGGFLLRDSLATNTLELFPFIDYVVIGEGEYPLFRLIQALGGGRDVTTVPSISYRSTSGKICINTHEEIVEDLNTLPIPDYSDYFQYRLKFMINPHPKIQLESSRGCRWSKCIFCVETMSSRKRRFRRKSEDRVAKEIEHLVRACGSLDLIFADADVSDKTEVFEAITHLNLDLHITAELAGFISKESLMVLRRAGGRQIQIGVESFDGALLKHFNKGVTLMKYVELLKWCKELEINVFYNIIIGSPFETDENVCTICKTMDYLKYFAYPNLTRFNVSYQSETFRCPDKFGISGITFQKELSECFPIDVCEKLTPLAAFGAYTGYSFSPENATDHSEIKSRVRRWKDNYDSAKTSLVCRDGGSFLDVSIIDGNSEYHYKIAGDLEREVYLYCIESAKDFRKILSRLGEANERAIRCALERFVSLKVMFCEGEEYLSLASMYNSAERKLMR